MSEDFTAPKPPSRWGNLLMGVLLGGVLGAGALYLANSRPGLLSSGGATTSTTAEASSQLDPEIGPPVEHRGLPQTPFEMGTLPPDEPVESIKITLGVGTQGAALTEPVDVHLGLGFPLRLYPLGGIKREPSFAVFPQKSSLEGMSSSIEPGHMASFEFSAKGDTDGLDTLRTAPQLLSNVKCGDLQRIGFASQGRTDWVLAGYRIEVNGKLFAANGLLNARAQDLLATSRSSLMAILPEYEAKTRKTQLTAEEKQSLRTEHALVRALSGRVLGAVPWIEETDDQFKPAPRPGGKVESLRIILTAGDGPSQGTRNPLYLQAGSSKFLLSSETAPLKDASEPQMYDLAPFELGMNPLSREALKLPGVGVVGSGAPADRVPDRAKLKRVVIEADGEVVYDSDKQAADQTTLPNVWLTPTSHFDESGTVVRSAVTATEVPLWTAGMAVAAESSPVLPEPPPPPPPPFPPAITGPAVGLPVPPLLPPDRFILVGGLPPPGGGPLLPFLNALAELLFPLPPPAAPLISGVRIAPATPIVRDGDSVLVNWTVGGPVATVASWRVELFAVLPHKPVPVLANPVAVLVGAPAGATSVLMPAINRANVAALLAPGSAEALYLYVQPRVTALGPLGNVITSANGSMLPLFPAGTTTAGVGLRRGPFLRPTGLFGFWGQAFQVTPVPPPPPGLPWAPMPLADPLAIRNAWSLTNEHGSHFGLLFATHENIPGATTLPSWSTAARPTGDGTEQITFRFEGMVPIPAGANGFRAVAHLGFVGGAAPATTGKVLARAELSSGPIRRNSSGNVVPPPFGAQPFFTLQTALAPLPISKAAPLALVDMPIRFDRLNAASFATYPLDPLNAAAYAVPPLNAGSFGFNAPAYVAQAGTGNIYITLTYMVTMTTADLTDAVGVLGVRLVPDNTP